MPEDRDDSSRRYPRSLTHVGVTVADVDRAIGFYRDVLGASVLLGPVEFKGEDPHAADFLGPAFGRNRVAYLELGNGVALEVFKFLEPRAERRPDGFEYWKTGFTHIAVVDPDVEGLARRVTEHGGRQRSAVWEIFPGRWAMFAEDPFGNVIEIYSHGTELTVANR